jgi:hypothetical protein
MNEGNLLFGPILMSRLDPLLSLCKQFNYRQCLGCVTFWWGSKSADPYLWD